LDLKLKANDRDFRRLDNHILTLERILVRDAPTVSLPERPKLERDIPEADGNNL